MTICIAALCERGSSLVVAGDTMVTHRGIPIEFEHATSKMTVLGYQGCVALTAGDALAHTELFDQVKGQICSLAAPSIQQVVECIKGAYNEKRVKNIEETILRRRGIDNLQAFYQIWRNLPEQVAYTMQQEIDSYDYGIEILVAGIGLDRAHIYSIINPGTSKCYDAIGFHAIGTGTPHAIVSLIVRESSPETPLPEALLCVYDAKKTAEKAPGVGATYTDLAVMTPKHSAFVSREAIDRIDPIYDKWKQGRAGWQEEIGAFLDGVLKPGEGGNEGKEGGESDRVQDTVGEGPSDLCREGPEVQSEDPRGEANTEDAAPGGPPSA